MLLCYVLEDPKTIKTYIFLSAEKHFKGVETTPEVHLQKQFFQNISLITQIFF